MIQTKRGRGSCCAVPNLVPCSCHQRFAASTAVRKGTLLPAQALRGGGHRQPQAQYHTAAAQRGHCKEILSSTALAREEVNSLQGEILQPFVELFCIYGAPFFAPLRELWRANPPARKELWRPHPLPYTTGCPHCVSRRPGARQRATAYPLSHTSAEECGVIDAFYGDFSCAARAYTGLAAFLAPGKPRARS